MTKAAFVTGASSGIGKAISDELLKEGYEVYGIGRYFKRKSENAHFHQTELDLLETKQLLAYLDTLPKDDLQVVVNNAGTAYYGLHEEMNPQKISEMLRVNLEVPEIIASRLIRTLRKNKGWLINIASVTAMSSSPHAAAYGSTKAGLLQFSRSLFDENRKYGVKVVCLLPDLTETNLYRNASFTTSSEQNERLEPEDIADALRYILSCREGMVIPEMILRPQKNRIVKKV